MGKDAAAIVGLAEWTPKRVWDEPMFGLEACAKLAAEALEDAQMDKDEVDGLVIGGLQDSPLFAPSALAEYLGIRSNFNEVVDLGGATSCGMAWRAAAAIEVGACDTVLVLAPSVPPPPKPEARKAPGKMRMPPYLGGDAWGSPQGQYEIPSGLVAATPGFALAASRYMAFYDCTQEMLAEVAVAARHNARSNPRASCRDKPITVEDVMDSRMVADPLKLLEIVMPCFGGAALAVTGKARAQRAPHRPAYLSGHGEHLTHKSITYAPDMIDTPVRVAAERAFRMAGAEREAIDLASMYDCYTITVALTIEDAGFCPKGQGGRFVAERDLTWDGGDWPLNTHGGQLGMGQAGSAGGMSHVTEAVRQIQGRGDGQVPGVDLAFVNGTGGILAEQVALILEGA